MSKFIYRIDPEKCLRCGVCEGECPENAIEEHIPDHTFKILEDYCSGCGKCMRICPGEAIFRTSSI